MNSCQFALTNQQSKAVPYFHMLTLSNREQQHRTAHHTTTTHTKTKNKQNMAKDTHSSTLNVSFYNNYGKRKEKMGLKKRNIKFDSQF